MKIFNLNNDYEVVCDSKTTRSGFKHTADLFFKGLCVYSTKICYLNRTWEYFEYESILYKTVNSFFDKKVSKIFSEVIKKLK